MIFPRVERSQKNQVTTKTLMTPIYNNRRRATDWKTETPCGKQATTATWQQDFIMRNRTALLVVDVQLGAFDGELCPVISGSDQLLANVSQLIDAARTSNVDVVFIQHCARAGEVFEQGTARWQIHPKIGPIEGEPIVAKHESSAFNRTNLHDILQSLNIDSLIICGLQSEHCVTNTSLSALALGYALTIAQDAHNTWPDGTLSAEQLVKRQNAILTQKGAVTTSTGELIQELKAGGI